MVYAASECLGEPRGGARYCWPGGRGRDRDRRERRWHWDRWTLIGLARALSFNRHLPCSATEDDVTQGSLLRYPRYVGYDLGAHRRAGVSPLVSLIRSPSKLPNASNLTSPITLISRMRAELNACKAYQLRVLRNSPSKERKFLTHPVKRHLVVESGELEVLPERVGLAVWSNSCQSSFRKGPPLVGT